MYINTLEELCFHLNNDCQLLPDLHLYLLFDGNLNSELNSTYFLLDNSPEYYPLFLNTHLEEHIHCSPYLVKLSAEPSKFVEWFFTYGKQWGFFYLSNHSLDEALRHWQHITFPRPNDIDNNTLLRFYDPKVMLSILDSKDPQKAFSALTPCQSLYCQNEDNRWIKHTPKESKASPLKATTKGLDHSLYTQAISKRCELTLWDKSPCLMEKFSSQSLDAAIQQGVNLALQSGFTQQNSILTFLRLWLERGPETLNSPEIQRYLQSTSTSHTEKIHYLRENTPQTDSWNQAPKPPIMI